MPRARRRRDASTTRREDLRERIKALTDGAGVDVVYDPVGGAYTEPAFRSIAWRGRPSSSASPRARFPKLPLNLALLKGASIVGVFWGDFARREPKAFAASVQQLGRWYAEGKLKPHVSQTLPLEKAAEAHQAARQPPGERQGRRHDGRRSVARPERRCIRTLSTQRPNLKPAERSVPTRRKPDDACRLIDAALRAVADHRDDLAVAERLAARDQLAQERRCRRRGPREPWRT